MSLHGMYPVSVATIVIASAAALLMIYHCIVVRWCNRRQIIATHQEMPHYVAEFQDFPTNLKDSITEHIPIYKFSKDMGPLSMSEDITCAICLCEFQDDEAIRVLPECLHSFHVPCVDMWLFSHSSCPLCRADTPIHYMAAGCRATVASNISQ